MENSRLDSLVSQVASLNDSDLVELAKVIHALLGARIEEEEAWLQLENDSEELAKYT